MLAVCQEMSWTYQIYMAQPVWFIDLLKDKMQMDSESIKKQINKTKHI